MSPATLRPVPSSTSSSLDSKTVALSPDGKLVASISQDDIERFNSLSSSEDPTTVVEEEQKSVEEQRQAIMERQKLILKGKEKPTGQKGQKPPESKLVAAASRGSTVRLWDAAAGVARHTPKSDSDWVRAVAFSPDGKVVASASDDSTIRLWDAATGVARHTLKGHSDWVWAVSFSPDGKVVASASRDKTVRLWDAATGAALQTLKGHTHSVRFRKGSARANPHHLTFTTRLNPMYLKINIYNNYCNLWAE
jgi:WD40 repeat protein